MMGLHEGYLDGLYGRDPNPELSQPGTEYEIGWLHGVEERKKVPLGGRPPRYVGYTPVNQLPVKKGDTVTIRKGTSITFKGKVKPAGRTHDVVVDHVLPGTVSTLDRLGFNAPQNPTVRWPGSGGYWSEVDINDLLKHDCTKLGGSPVL
jgi:hypothetical protein